jgi:P-type E1-E2 ATPase
MWQTIRAGRYGIDAAALITIVASIVLHQYWASIVVAIGLTSRPWLESVVTRSARKYPDKLLERLPHRAQVLRKNKLVDILIDDILVSDKLLIHPGEIVPVDARIIEGSGTFDEAALGGSSQPQIRGVGDIVLSGSINIDGEITAKVTRLAIDSQYQQIVRITRSAIDSPLPLAHSIDWYSAFFMVGSYIIATAAWLISGQPLRFLEVFIVATPLSFLLTPTAIYIIGLSRAFRDGIIVKTNTTLEQLAKVKGIAFDKTDTLISDLPAVDTIVPSSPYNQRDVLTYAGSLMQRSNYLLAKAVNSAVAAKNLRLLRVKHIAEVAGLGAEAHISNKDVLVGRLDLIQQRGVNMPKQIKASRINQAAVFVAIDGNFVGYITFKENIRADAKPMFDALSLFGITRSLMITDDSQTTASKVAKRLGISDTRAGILPGDELLAIESFDARPLAYIGNALSDATILTAADIGIALGARGNVVAGEAADVIIMQNDLSYIVRVVANAKRTLRLVKLSVVLGAAICLAAMLVFASGRFSSLTSAIVRSAIEIVITLGVLRTYRYKTRI